MECVSTYYERSRRLWVAYYHDEFGQIGEASYGLTRDKAIFELGFRLGRNPQKFTRPMSQLMEAYDKEVA